jgi:hypothetical protein
MNPTQRSWWSRPSCAVLAFILLLVVVGLGAFRVASKHALNRTLEEMHAKGLPMNPKELDAWYETVPVAENAGVKLLEAYAVFVEPKKESDPGEVDWKKFPLGAALDGETIRILETHIGNNAEALRLMAQAAKMERSRYPIDLSKAPDITLNHLMGLKRLVQLARWNAVLKAEKGDAAGAAEALKDGFAVAHTLAQEPMLISELVRMACVGVQVVGMERVVNVVRLDDAQLTDLATKCRQAADDSRLSLRRALIGERAFSNTGRKMAFNEYEQVRTMWGMVPNTSEVPEFLRMMFFYSRRAMGLQNRDNAFFMRTLGRMIDAAALGEPEQFVTSEALVAEIGLELSKHPIGYELSNLSLGSMLYVPKKEAILTARLQCVRMVLDVERWRRKHGDRLPGKEELNSILNDFPRDPVDGTRLEYRPNGQGGYRIIAPAATAAEKKNGGNLKSLGIGCSIEK